MEMKSRRAAVQKHWVQLPGSALRAICLTGNESFQPEGTAVHSASPGQGEHAGCASLCAVGLLAPMFCRPARPAHGLPDLSPNALCCPTGAELSSCSPRSFPHPHRYRSVTSQYWGPRCHRSATAAVTPPPPPSFGTVWGGGGPGWPWGCSAQCPHTQWLWRC